MSIPLKFQGYLIFFLSMFFRFGIFNPTVVYDHLGEIFSALIFGSFVFCIFLYIKVRIEPWCKNSFQVATHTTSVYISMTNGLCILGSCCTIFHWFWFIWKRNNWFLLGKCLQIYMIFRFYVSNFYNLQLINNVVYFSNHYRIWCYIVYFPHFP